jgi:hypothetical protein
MTVRPRRPLSTPAPAAAAALLSLALLVAPASRAGAAEPPAAPAPAPPTEAQRLTQVEEGLSALKKLKFAGYIHPRYERRDESDFGLDPRTNAPRELDRFFIRRARFKATYSGAWSEYMIQIDAAGRDNDALLRDAEASLVLDDKLFSSPEAWQVKLTLGQFKAPFGFETLESSGDREMPDRAAVIRRFFPGERDRGFRFQGSWRIFKLQAALINGNFTTDPIYRTFDQTSWKDVVGRLGVDLTWLAAGLSGYWGHSLRTTPGRPASGMTPATEPTYERFRRRLVGADAQTYLRVPRVGRIAVKGEVIYGADDGLSFSGLPPDPCKNLTTLGWYLTVVQRIGERFGVIARLDQLDPNIDDPAETCADAVRTGATEDRVTTIGAGLLVDATKNLRAVLVYEHAAEQGARVKDNDALILQVQAKF